MLNGQGVVRRAGTPVGKSGEGQIKPAAISTTFDLSKFKLYDDSSRRQRHGESYITIAKRGICFSAEFGRRYETGSKINIFYNRAGQVIVLAESDSGIPVRQSSLKCKAIHCGGLIQDIAESGLELPLRVTPEWNEAMKAWVCRLPKKEQRS
jgi:hypothetical protein